MSIWCLRKELSGKIPFIPSFNPFSLVINKEWEHLLWLHCIEDYETGKDVTESYHESWPFYGSTVDKKRWDEGKEEF